MQCQTPCTGDQLGRLQLVAGEEMGQHQHRPWHKTSCWCRVCVPQMISKDDSNWWQVKKWDSIDTDPDIKPVVDAKSVFRRWSARTTPTGGRRRNGTVSTQTLLGWSLHRNFRSGGPPVLPSSEPSANTLVCLVSVFVMHILSCESWMTITLFLWEFSCFSFYIFDSGWMLMSNVSPRYDL